MVFLSSYFHSSSSFEDTSDKPLPPDIDKIMYYIFNTTYSRGNKLDLVNKIAKKGNISKHLDYIYYEVFAVNYTFGLSKPKGSKVHYLMTEILKAEFRNVIGVMSKKKLDRRIHMILCDASERELEDIDAIRRYVILTDKSDFVQEAIARVPFDKKGKVRSANELVETGEHVFLMSL